MTQEELVKFKKPMPPALAKLPVKFVAERIEDKYGVYETGFFHFKGKQIFVNKEDGMWHLSIAAKHTLGYYELKEVRYKFMPDNMQVAQIFPAREDFVNISPNIFHLFELGIGVVDVDEDDGDRIKADTRHWLQNGEIREWEG